MTFASSILKKLSTPIHYLWGVNGLGEECYWFVCCPTNKYDELIKSAGNANIEDYGVIIAKGIGRVPDEATKQMLISEYKVNWADYEGAIG